MAALLSNLEPSVSLQAGDQLANRDRHAWQNGTPRGSVARRRGKGTRSLARLEAILPSGVVAGERYAADGMKFVGR